MYEEVAPGDRVPVPRSGGDDYTPEMAARRREFVRARTGVDLAHVAHTSVSPSLASGNVENFMGVAQVPIGLAGPIRVQGEHANGDYYVPLATTEGTLVASYNRGMRLLTECGGVRATVVERSMQRAPVFILGDAREAREFGRWVEEHFAAIKEVAEDTTRTGKLLSIGQYQVGPLRYLRFNYTTGDAAGQNMTAKATFVACEWIRRHCPGQVRYLLSGNMETDKKHSHLNALLTRGRRVVAEAVLRRDVLERLTGADTRDLFYFRQVQMAGAFLAGAASNGAHAANGLAALFIATGQDVADIAESHATMGYSQLLPNGDFYISITIPSLIVATYGGGTGLPTQKECLEVLGCYGQGKADALAEICAAVVLAGEISLVAALVRGDWVASHERLGRNRP
ncbi:MAG TPA: hydroxymethylglutaryl-CoA reductase [Anaeromyxobacteraceae bacterium]|nr:hydroxymethylglutaryl-CoA reductase [Anaeromyxobacteraceae bacterium]